MVVYSFELVCVSVWVLPIWDGSALLGGFCRVLCGVQLWVLAGCESWGGVWSRLCVLGVAVCVGIHLWVLAGCESWGGVWSRLCVLGVAVGVGIQLWVLAGCDFRR